MNKLHSIFTFASLALTVASFSCLYATKLEMVNYTPFELTISLTTKGGQNVQNIPLHPKGASETLSSMILPVELQEIQKLVVFKTAVPHVTYALDATSETSNQLKKALELSEGKFNTTIFIDWAGGRLQFSAEKYSGRPLV